VILVPTLVAIGLTLPGAEILHGAFRRSDQEPLAVVSTPAVVVRSIAPP
jgi:hypothetical protein